MKRSLLLLLPFATACAASVPAPTEVDPTEATHEAAPELAPPPPQFVAVVTSKLSKVITADFDGRIEKLLVHGDQYVHAGDIVAQLDIHELRAKLEEAQARRAEARAQAARAGALYSQAARKAKVEEHLMRSGASAPEAVRSALSEANAASAEGGAAEESIHEASAAIEELERLIGTANVKAPIDGIVSTVKAKEGEVAHKGTPIARVFDPSDLVIKFAVPREQRALVKLGDSVELVYDADHRVIASVRSIEDDHDPAIEFLQVEAELDAHGRPDDLRVGVTGHVHVATAAAKGAAR
ncbi:MAG: efflux RND transporter periplasmic adaptor subunit [Acidobacteriota bacterium]